MTNSQNKELDDLQAYKKAYEEARKTYEEALKAFEEAHKVYKEAFNEVYGNARRRERERAYDRHRLNIIKPDGIRTKTVALSDEEKTLLQQLPQRDRYEAYQTILAARTGAGKEDERVA